MLILFQKYNVMNASSLANTNFDLEHDIFNEGEHFKTSSLKAKLDSIRSDDAN